MSIHPGLDPVPAPVRPRLGEALVALGLLSPGDLDHAVEEQTRARGRRLGTILQDRALVSELDVARALAVVHELPLLDLDAVAIDPAVARLVPRAVAQRLGVLVYARDGAHLSVAVADPVDVVALDDVRMITGATSLTVGLAPRSVISAAVARVWAERDDEDALQAFVDETTVTAVTGEEDADEDAATIRLVDRLLALAVRERASDVHIEPHRRGVLVRLRVDGVLREVLELPAGGYAALAARLKIVANLDVIERRLPQDGRARIRVPGGFIDARVSTLPALHGEKVVVRILPSAARLPGLAGLGVPPAQRQHLLDAILRPQGLVLITGPTGSGKTNTLYAALSEGVDRTRNVMTLEDPVEIELPGITQVQVDDRTGLTFARALRASLRQDPDVILVGEIRDQETADLAIRAALTGHMVLSTLHTLDCAAAISRLADMGVPRYLVTSSLSLVVSQRLVRRPCPSCSVADPFVAAALDEAGITDHDGRWVQVAGCPACSSTGYAGRTAVLEVLPVTAAIRAALLAGADEDALRRAARAEGHESLFESGVAKARLGETTLAEVLRAVPRDPGRSAVDGQRGSDPSGGSAA